MAHTIADFVAKIPDAIEDDANALGGVTGTLLPALVERTIVQRYSQDRALEIVSDVAGNSTHYLDLPVAPGDGDDLPLFEPEFSVIKSIEYPIEQQPPQLVDESDFRVYRSPQGYKLLINFDTPGPNDTCRITWTARHLADGSTVLERDFYAIVDYAGSLAAEKLASKYVQIGDSTIQADVVNYRTRSSEMLTIAKTLRKRYYNHMGIEEGASGTNEQAPAFALGHQWLEQNSGVDRLVHDKYTR